jgi:hypothetical protein
MKNISDNVVIQIEVTNACHLSCANCSRLVGHHKKPFYMSLDQIRNAILSLDGFEGRIGLMGGEPTLHPKFKEICEMYRELIPNKRKREFWTAGYKWDEYKEIINITFDNDLVHYNDHSKPDEGWHQPLLISIDEVVDDKRKMWKLIDNCWVQKRWSASITPKGAFFCEVAAALDHAMDGPGGWDITPGWWRKKTSDYNTQKSFACLKCSAALPLDDIPNNHLPVDMISKSNLELLNTNKSPKIKAQRIKIVKKEDAVRYLNSADEVELGERGYLKSHPDWRPSEFRTKAWHGPGEGDLSAKEVRSMQIKGKNLDTIKNESKTKDKVALINSSLYEINENNLNKIKLIIGEKAQILEQLNGIKFSSAKDLIISVDSWTNSSLTEREKVIICNESTLDM